MRTMLFLLLLSASAGAMAQTPADLARLEGPSAAPSVAEAPVVQYVASGGSAWDLARLQTLGGALPASVNTLPDRLAEAHGFVASDLARFSGGSAGSYRRNAEMIALLPPAR